MARIPVLTYVWWIGYGSETYTIDQEDIIQRGGDDLSLQQGDSREGHAE